MYAAEVWSASDPLAVVAAHSLTISHSYYNSACVHLEVLTTSQSLSVPVHNGDVHIDLFSSQTQCLSTTVYY